MGKDQMAFNIKASHVFVTFKDYNISMGKNIKLECFVCIKKISLPFIATRTIH